MLVQPERGGRDVQRKSERRKGVAQVGAAKELETGAQILRNLKAPIKMMVGEHDWYLDMGEKWRELFGAPTYSFDHKGAHCVVLNSIIEADFWTARKMTPEQRLLTVAGLDNGVQSRFTVGAEQRKWLENDPKGKPANMPSIVFSHSALYELFRDWNFWTDDAEAVQAILKRFDNVVVFLGHTHQMLTNRIGNIHFHGMLSTAWPWPYAPQGLPELTVQMGRGGPSVRSDRRLQQRSHRADRRSHLRQDHRAGRWVVEDGDRARRHRRLGGVPRCRPARERRRRFV